MDKLPKLIPLLFIFLVSSLIVYLLFFNKPTEKGNLSNEQLLTSITSYWNKEEFYTDSDIELGTITVEILDYANFDGQYILNVLLVDEQKSNYKLNVLLKKENDDEEFLNTNKINSFEKNITLVGDGQVEYSIKKVTDEDFTTFFLKNKGKLVNLLVYKNYFGNKQNLCTKNSLDCSFLSVQEKYGHQLFTKTLNLNDKNLYIISYGVLILEDSHFN